MPDISPPASSMAIANQRFRDADSWRLAFDLSALRYHGYVMLWLTLRSLYRGCMRSRRVTSEQLAYLASRIDEAHDFALTEFENMGAAARNSRAAELGARIAFEDYEESKEKKR